MSIYTQRKLYIHMKLQNVQLVGVVDWLYK